MVPVDGLTARDLCGLGEIKDSKKYTIVLFLGEIGKLIATGHLENSRSNNDIRKIKEIRKLFLRTNHSTFSLTYSEIIPYMFALLKSL